MTEPATAEVAEKPKNRHGGARPGSGRKTKDGRKGMIRISVSLDSETMAFCREIGQGDISAGIRIAVAMANPEGLRSLKAR